MREKWPLSRALPKVYLPSSAVKHLLIRYLGIGAAVAKNLASKGANILINYLTEASDAPAKKLAEELSLAYNIKAVPCRADISTQEGCDKIIATCKSELPRNAKTGAQQIDILVHSAATFQYVVVLNFLAFGMEFQLKQTSEMPLKLCLNSRKHTGIVLLTNA